MRNLQFAFAANEELRAFAYQTIVGVERYAVASSRGIYWIFAGQPPQLLWQEPVAQADVHSDYFVAFAPGGAGAVFLSSQIGGYEPSASGDLAPVGGLAVSGFPAGGSSVIPHPQLAVARTFRYAAGGTASIVKLYALLPGVDGLADLGGWPAVDAFGLAFRPLAR